MCDDDSAKRNPKGAKRDAEHQLLRPPRQARGKLQETVPPEAHCRKAALGKEKR
jgi:hypothetical protein